MSHVPTDPMDDRYLLHMRLGADRLTRVLVSAMVLVLAAHTVVAIGRLFFEVELNSLNQLFDVDQEANLPTFFNTALLLIVVVLSALAFRATGRKDRPWRLLVFVFLFLALDESTQLHEKLVNTTRRALEPVTGDVGFLYFAWVVPYSLLLIGFAVVMFSFLARLPLRTRTGLVLSGAVYALGAVVCEMIGADIAQPFASVQQALHAPAYVAISTLEETLEMVGLIMAIHALMRWLEGTRVTARIDFIDPAEKA